MSMLRAFIAIKMTAAIQAKLGDIQKKLKQIGVEVSWVQPENMHLTVQFLGNIEEDQVAPIVAHIKESVKLVTPFQLQIGYAGAFPNLQYPRVVWIGVTDDEAGSLKRLQEDMTTRLGKMGFDQEEGRFKPHLTLGRVRSQKNKSSLLRAMEGIANIWVGEVLVNAVYLIKSELKPTGAEYTDLAEVAI
jgi:RNA 2',3'-cyclic 3'-phosphodiesterase